MKRSYGLVPAILISLFGLAGAQDGEWSEPQLVEGINFNRTDMFPSISADGRKLYFSSTRSNNEDIYVSERVDGGWTTPVNLGPPINSDERDICPSISSDGRTLYFVSYNRAGGYGGYDIWYSTWEDSCECWSEIMNPGPNINSSWWEWTPSISHDRSKLYFATDSPQRPGHLSGFDLYVSEMGEDGWQPPENLGINTYNTEYCPSIAWDDTTLYFASWHHHNLPCWHGGGVDIFVVYYTGGEWTNMANLCDPVNTEAWDRAPSISSDGDTLYFASRRDSEFEDIYYSVKLPTAVEEGESHSDLNESLQVKVWPNPFNSAATIQYELKVKSDIIVDIFDLLGRKILHRELAGQAAGFHNYQLKMDQFPSGVYFLKLSTDNGWSSRINIALLK